MEFKLKIKTAPILLSLLILLSCNMSSDQNSSGLEITDENDYYIYSAKVLSFDEQVNQVILDMDFNGDGRKDLLLGAIQPSVKEPLHIVLNNGDGSFTEAAENYLSRQISMYNPVGTTGDFNNDGNLDIILFDRGNGSGISGGFVGDLPWLLLGSGGGNEWQVSTLLQAAVIDAQEVGDFTDDGKLYAHALTTGDIDNDGDLDFFLETGGGYNFIDPCFFINQFAQDGTLSFSIENHLRNPERIDHAVIWGPDDGSNSWRWGAHALIDMDDDSHLDLVSASYRPDDDQQRSVRNRIVLNNGSAQFKFDDNFMLPLSDWNGGYTFSRSLIVEDLNNDTKPDIIINMDRAPMSGDYEYSTTGRYLQIYMNNSNSGSPAFIDDTNVIFGNQTVTLNTQYGGGPNNNSGKMKLIDFDDDGDKDIFVGSVQDIELNPGNPPVYINDGTGAFSMVNFDYFTFSSSPHLKMAYPLDLNRDGTMDFVFLNNKEGSTYFLDVLISK